jgi:hypothetical protein
VLGYGIASFSGEVPVITESSHVRSWGSRGREESADRALTGGSGVLASAQARRPCFPICHCCCSSGGSRVGEAVGKLPHTPGASPPRSPHPRSPSLQCVVVTLSEGVTWRRCSPQSRGGDRVGTQQGGRRLCKRNMPPITRNPPAAHSLLYLAPTAHSSRDTKEVTPCHPGPNRPDHHPHRS